jgi:hypothetical protein
MYVSYAVWLHFDCVCDCRALFSRMYDFNYISSFYIKSDSSFHIVKILGILYKTNKSGLYWDYVCLSIGLSVHIWHDVNDYCQSCFHEIEYRSSLQRGVKQARISRKSLRDSHSFVKAINKLLPVLSILFDYLGEVQFRPSPHNAVE